LHAISSRKGKTTSDRFDRTASTQEETDQPCLLEIHGKVYNITAWAKAHPGGETVLRMFHGRNATLAFDTAGHSQKAYDMLREFEVAEVDDGRETMSDFQNKETEASSLTAMATKKKPRWRAKLFTKEDPVGIHK
jgi:cytochrome-b5 reductase